MNQLRLPKKSNRFTLLLAWAILSSSSHLLTADDLVAVGYLVRVSTPNTSNVAARLTSSNAKPKAVIEGVGATAGSSWMAINFSPAIAPRINVGGTRLSSTALVPASATLSPKDAWESIYAKLRPSTGGIHANTLVAGQILDIEPNYLLPLEQKPSPQSAPAASSEPPAQDPTEATIGHPVNPTWPNDSAFAWHLGDGYSQLLKARNRVANLYHHGEQPIIIAHLDTGYDPKHISVPRYFNADESITYAQDGITQIGKGEANGVTHGTGTLALLAGKRVQLQSPAFDDDVGGAPDAQVFEVKIDVGNILPVVHFATATMAAGINYAVAHHADVISISAGGIPSRMWVDAVNNAYENGTVIVAASGDFYTFPVFGFPVTPFGTVYPAAFPRVLAVSGVTETGSPYGLSGNLARFLPWYWINASMRGSYGPESALKKEVASYAPNVPWALCTTAPTPHHHEFDLNGGGTSASTPQVAAAAALWLAYYNNNENLKPLGSWQRAEAVYQVLEKAVKQATKPLYVGLGILQANDALQEVPPDPTTLSQQKDAVSDLQWLSLLFPLSNQLSPRSLSAFPGNETVVRRALELETAQLIARSEKLQEICSPLTSSSPQADKNAAAEAIAADPNCSSTLKAYIEAALVRDNH